MWHFLRSGSVVMVAAVVAGAGVSLVAASTVADLVYGVGVRDAGSLTAAVVVTLVIGAVALFVPSRRASRANILSVLRES